MGLFFTNLHVLKNDEISRATILKELCRIMKKQGYCPTENGTPDATFHISDPNSKWISICSDLYESFDENFHRKLCLPLANRLKTPIMLISCFDSDFTYFTLIDVQNNLESWARAGEDYYSDQEETYKSEDWQNIIKDTVAFEAALRKERVFSEEAIEEIEPMLGMAKGQGFFMPDTSDEMPATEKICFSLTEQPAGQEPPRLQTYQPSLSPCRMGERNNIVGAINLGGASTGLGIAFVGNYVEKDEIRFEDVCLEYDLDEPGGRKTIPIVLTKRQTKDGNYIYYAEVPDFRIPEKVNPKLSGSKRQKEDFRKQFLVRFTPVGNVRKLLDICVVLFPLENPSGQCSWCVWHHFGSKQAYLEECNDCWNLFPGAQLKPLDPDDYDL
ncbi:MAG: hypothetical protein IJR39_13550 [Treponema sp.]|nr:hypothetical protein [Treponema sp.]